ncbi:cutinase family protein [Candidatus Saccharibacteria bacterium]|nr:cutinase family protein [Candidatus Saccharibacteria bacterium]
MTINGKLLYVAGTIVCASILNPVINPTATASACKDVEFIFARGSGSGFNGRNETAWQNGLTEQLKNTALTYDFYELGSRSYNGAQYPAASIGFENLKNALTLFSAAFDAAGIGTFNRSVEEGVVEAIGRVEAISSSCPYTKFVLGGYSQGALVVDRAAKKIDPEKIAYVATFGDPNLYLPEGYGINPPACRGENLSNYRIFAPDCRAYAGLIGTNKPYGPESLLKHKRVGLWCTKKDIFCSDTINLADPIGDHLAYRDNGLYYSAAKTIVKKVLEFYPTKQAAAVASAKKSAARRDTAILIDTTGSMSGVIDWYRSEALRLASETLSAGGRVALFEYRDLDDPYKTRKILDFGCSYDDFKTALDNLTVDGGGDEPESALSGALYAMDNLAWRPGATKSLIILTDASYHNPDRDGTTLEAVTKRSLEIDPVNIYAIVPDVTAPAYADLVAATNGRVFTMENELSLSTDYLLARPEINLALEEYQGRPGENFTFSVETDEEDLAYDWDLDFDGTFETMNAGKTVTKAYAAETSGFVQVRATNEGGLSSTASAKVTITNNAEPAPEILSLSHSGNVVNFTTSANTYATLVVAGDVPLGITNDHTININADENETEILLIPLTRSGLKGAGKSIALPAASIDLKAPKAGLL